MFDGGNAFDFGVARDLENHHKICSRLLSSQVTQIVRMAKCLSNADGHRRVTWYDLRVELDKYQRMMGDLNRFVWLVLRWFGLGWLGWLVISTNKVVVNMRNIAVGIRGEICIDQIYKIVYYIDMYQL
jgi:hypothetical protein